MQSAITTVSDKANQYQKEFSNFIKKGGEEKNQLKLNIYISNLYAIYPIYSEHNKLLAKAFLISIKNINLQKELVDPKIVMNVNALKASVLLITSIFLKLLLQYHLT